MKKFTEIEPKTITFQETEIKIKQHLPFSTISLISNIVANSYFVFDENDNIIGYSEIEKEKALVYCTLKYFADIEPEENDDEDEFIDNAVASGLYNEITNNIYSPLADIQIQVDAEIEFIKETEKNKNNVAYVIKSFLDDLSAKLPEKSLKKIFKNLEKVDLSNFAGFGAIKNEE